MEDGRPCLIVLDIVPDSCFCQSHVSRNTAVTGRHDLPVLENLLGELVLKSGFRMPAGQETFPQALIEEVWMPACRRPPLMSF